MLGGLSLIIASACVLNNYIDRDIDKKMARTKNRALVSGRISVRAAIAYAIILGLGGTALLILFTNWITVLVALAALLVYVTVYGYFKRASVHGTVVGSLAGAVPPVVGYLAVTNHVDKAAVILFLIMVFWQMPHFYAIAIYRFKDYKNAGLPVLPVKKSIHTAKIYMLVYILGFAATALSLSLFGYTGIVYVVITLLLGIGWLRLSIKGFRADDDALWARTMFRFSLVVITLLSITISLDALWS